MYSRLASFRDSDCANPGEAHVAAVLPLIAAGSSTTASSSRPLIEACIGKLRQELVGLFLLPQRLLEKVDRIVPPERGGPRPESTVTRNFVVLNGAGTCPADPSRGPGIPRSPTMPRMASQILPRAGRLIISKTLSRRSTWPPAYAVWTIFHHDATLKGTSRPRPGCH
jgi:hypothetical protein